MALTKIPSELSSTTGIVDNSNATAITIDSNENVLVGKTATTGNVAGISLRSTGLIVGTVNNGTVGYFNRTNGDGTILDFRKDNSAVGSIGVGNSNDLTIGTADTGLVFQDNERISPWNPSTNSLRDAAIDFGDSDRRFKDLYLSSDIYLNNTNKSSIPSGALSLIFNTSSASNANVLSGGYGGSHAHQQFYHGGSLVGSITTTASSVSLVSSSDYRLKENVVELTGATERLKQLNPSRFNFIADADTTVDGFLAHEVADVVPEAISGEKDAMKDEEYEVTPAVLDEEGNVVTEAVIGTRSVPEYQGIDQSKLVPLLVATIQELEARITELENN